MNKANPDALLELAERERQLRESIIHGLRMQGWSRMDAEDEALTRIEKFRARAQQQEKEHETTQS